MLSRQAPIATVRAIAPKVTWRTMRPWFRLYKPACRNSPSQEIAVAFFSAIVLGSLPCQPHLAKRTHQAFSVEIESAQRDASPAERAEPALVGRPALASLESPLAGPL